jgi:hypothetical protein
VVVRSMIDHRRVLCGAGRTAQDSASGIGGNRAPAAPGQRATCALLCTIGHWEVKKVGGKQERRGRRSSPHIDRSEVRQRRQGR